MTVVHEINNREKATVIKNNLLNKYGTAPMEMNTSAYINSERKRTRTGIIGFVVFSMPKFVYGNSLADDALVPHPHPIFMTSTIKQQARKTVFSPL